MTRAMKAFFWLVVFIGLAAVASAVVVGSRYRDVEVEPEPYEAGLRWDEDRSRMKRLGWSAETASIEIGRGRAVLVMDITGKDGGAVSLRTVGVSVLASRPAGDLDDVPCAVDLPRKGRIRAECGNLSFGHWDFIIEIKTEKGPARIVERGYVEKATR